MKRLENDEEIDWTVCFNGLPFMTKSVIDIFNTVMNGNRLKIEPEDMHNALHTANYIESPFMLNLLIIKCLKKKKFGRLVDLPEFVCDCILQDPELSKKWFYHISQDFGPSRAERAWSDTIFWKCIVPDGPTCWHVMWDSFMRDKGLCRHGNQALFNFMYNKGMVHMLNIIPLDEDYCPVYRLLTDAYSYPIDNPLSLHEQVQVPAWLLILLETVPGYLTRRLIGKKKQSLAELIVINGQDGILRACIDHIPEDTRTWDNKMLMDVSILSNPECFIILSEHGFLPSSAIWEKVFEKATIMRYFITTEVHWLTSMPGVPPIPPEVSIRMLSGDYWSKCTDPHDSYVWSHTNRTKTHIQYLYNWNAQKITDGHRDGHCRCPSCVHINI